MLRSEREFRRYRRLLGAVADKSALRTHAQRQSQRIEQDRFARAGLAGQHAEAAMESEIEPVDQHDVPDGESQKHQVFARSSAVVPRAR